MKRLTYRPAALDDLRAIATYIAKDNPERAISFIAELRDKAAQAAERPERFPARDDLAAGLRAARLRRYLILFLNLPDEVQIVRVLHGARDLGRLFEE